MNNLISSDSIKTLAPLLLKAQQGMGNVAKTADNPYFSSKYADLNAIREMAIPVLNGLGISVLQPMVSYDGKVFVRTLLLHESGEWLASDTEVVNKKESDPQAHGSGISYARRYGLQSLLNIGAVDDDAEVAMGRKATTTSTKSASSSTASTSKTTVSSFRKNQTNGTASKPAATTSGATWK